MLNYLQFIAKFVTLNECQFLSIIIERRRIERFVVYQHRQFPSSLWTIRRKEFDWCKKV